ncbi:SDR family NAD(P)-dependent oxidoreductase [Salarchaeum sp. JOR-1]|uniref:SDR family NAD(P)-dependent oxidoreductase n=1 Tax=Salarchaeum sp. JOR-1 TaxID=2599399 RepID=UPI0011988621|nr:SDR family NAD(P)-dependent oxidoreductase [Salarchaeum sp. JOR-1]QDX40986.1 SDR family oxidoreductase [Salarchaeum sp. JOR-1]
MAETALVTGAGAGIGRAIARQLADDGYHVVVTDIDPDGGQETVDIVEDDGGRATFTELDVTDHDAVEATIDATVEEYSGLDVLVNNAGVGHEPALVEDVSVADRDRLISVNVDGVWNGCHAAIPHMKRAGEGRIVNISSLAGVVGSPRIATYSLTKGAVLNFTRAIAAELGPAGVRANAVCPGFVETSMADEFFAGSDDPEKARERMERQYPLRRLGHPDEVADAVSFLASENSSYITGHGLLVDGGFNAT